MASCWMRFPMFSRRFSLFSSGLAKKTMADPVDHATGLEKKELLARISGNDNPFDLRVLKRGSGCRDSPNMIPSSFDARLVGCVCDEDSTSLQWMWLHQGCPRRCACGHWFQLTYKPPL
ncbi:unnamed protein product [Nezara viridula]|nr:unnamed protein product [Nezara viridula]